ncbi:DEAD/DEAH box helicase [Lichenihabitans sp. Uapishka_5]|uniref:DEAD/DEAH box helicase n=1 Tax=Lichenihabitans sp. Uapishka_5 TaxID=3037302 RepID=UPI0029E80B65|nr:DEAD/DEAH box helicase [Lichenihabitans sp. Uapishka_5]MDX7951483.1 DEAD/DEAH box helicase [Lichenihabitans sp. Uapishka_5]
MTNSPRSVSDRTSSVGAFGLLSEPARRWVERQGWTSLRDVQERAIPAILAGGDVVVSARTAAGKTEAAFLPLLTKVEGDAAGFRIVCVSPLKALINDQANRLEGLAEACGHPLHRWHGDVSASAKRRARENPSGVVLITPESLEAILLRQGVHARPLFAGLQAVVVDELHAFIGTERGIHLQSLLTRVEAIAGRDRIDRIGLSATLGDMALAADCLRPGDGPSVRLVEGRDAGNVVKVQIRGYVRPTRVPEDAIASSRHAPGASPREDGSDPAFEAVVSDLGRILRGRTNLLFAGSRRNVEAYADALTTACGSAGVPNEFFAHHGNLSRAHREEVETRLRDDPRPSTAVATTTLELGIDIGDVAAVAQIGPGSSVSSLRQRLGRSGRRPGTSAELRIFVIEDEDGPAAHPIDRLKLGLIQSMATVDCMLGGWCEPPPAAGLHLSTLVHQTLALIVQTGGISAKAAWAILCGRGPFRSVDRVRYAALLRCMHEARSPLVEQAPGGQLMLGPGGERLASGHDFYAVFVTPEEYRVVHGGQTLGTLPLDRITLPGQTMIFVGRRWRVLEVDADARVILVEPTSAAMPPRFDGSAGPLHDHVVAEMRRILSGGDVPTYLDQTARSMLEGARHAYRELGLEAASVVEVGTGVVLVPWVGTRKLDTLAAALVAMQHKPAARRHFVEVDGCDTVRIRRTLARIAGGDHPSDAALASAVPSPAIAKYDGWLSPDLMRAVVISERLETASLRETASRVLASGTDHEPGDTPHRAGTET